jgi:site-specific recombinase XerD
LPTFDEHLRRARGVCPGTRRNYARFVRAFLQAVFDEGPVGFAEIHPGEVIGFVGGLTRRYRPATVEHAASALRSFFRFLRAVGLRDDRLEDAVPMVPRRRSGLVRHLDPGRFDRLIASLGSSSPRGLRDRAIILCMARLGLRASEVVALRLEDLDWRNATVRVRARKTGRGALLPLPGEVGAALADYLRHARPDTRARQVFVLHRLRVGEPISSSIVGRAVDNALRRAGMVAPMRGANLLRHSLATDLLGHGASLREIADLFGHRSLATTRIYASVDVAALREVALPWPQVTS